MTIQCPLSQVGCLIGKGGTTVKGIQLFTSAMVEIDQTSDPATVRITGNTLLSVHTAASIIEDIIAKTFKGFALLRELGLKRSGGLSLHARDTRLLCDQLAYFPGLGLFPRRHDPTPE